MLNLYFSVPMSEPNESTEKTLNDENPASKRSLHVFPPSTSYRRSAGPYMLVLDKSGRIDLLDKKTLEFAGTAGYLPAPPTAFPSKKSVGPGDLLAYEIFGLSLWQKQKYLGMISTSLCREGTALALAVFDKEAKLVRKDHTKTEALGDPRYRLRYSPSSETVFFHSPWAPTVTILKYLAENLQPPILSLASYFTASSFEAASGYTGLFILPNSFIAMLGRDVEQSVTAKFFLALLLILPSIILAILLAIRVNKDAAFRGLSEHAKLYWLIGTMCFGPCAYITYRLTRPKDTLVTCQNCGKFRRPDMVRCHHCRSGWHIPDLEAPGWRVTDSQGLG